MKEPTFLFFRQDNLNGQPLVYLKGDWVLANFLAIKQEIEQLDNINLAPTYQLAELGELDTSGAAQIVALLGNEQTIKLAQSLPSTRQALLNIVSDSLKTENSPPAPPKSVNTMVEILARIGASVTSFYSNIVELLGFIGLTLDTIARIAFRPSRWRLTSLAANIETSGLNAIPIVALLTFLVGAVIAFLGLSLLNQFGAGIYAVSLVALAFLREFGVLLTAIIVAGRTASSYTAQIGSMKANEEIDALKVSGLNPIELLVLPRVMALLISLPALTFIAMICGIAGGMLVCITTLNISAQMFFSLILTNVDVRHFYLGIGKAPLFAFLIAIIGCMQGFKSGGSAASVGAHTTTSVVHAIFIVILLDAIAAMFFMEMGW